MRSQQIEAYCNVIFAAMTMIGRTVEAVMFATWELRISPRYSRMNRAFHRAEFPKMRRALV